MAHAYLAPPKAETVRLACFTAPGQAQLRSRRPSFALVTRRKLPCQNARPFSSCDALPRVVLSQGTTTSDPSQVRRNLSPKHLYAAGSCIEDMLLSIRSIVPKFLVHHIVLDLSGLDRRPVMQPISASCAKCAFTPYYRQTLT